MRADKVGVGEITHGTVFAQPAQVQVVAPRPIGMPVDRLMGDIQPPPAWEASELTAHGLPPVGV